MSSTPQSSLHGYCRHGHNHGAEGGGKTRGNEASQRTTLGIKPCREKRDTHAVKSEILPRRLQPERDKLDKRLIHALGQR